MNEISMGGIVSANVIRAPGSHAPTTATLAADNVDDSTAVACPLPTGGATVHHPLTLHYTGANQSDEHRSSGSCTLVRTVGFVGVCIRESWPPEFAATLVAGAKPGAWQPSQTRITSVFRVLEE
jgi:hypothetical protein